MPELETTSISRLKPPDLIPGYRLEKLVGKGGMGEVHKATQLSLGRTVAIKLLSGDLAKDQAFVTRFEKEGAALAALSHPNIVSIVDKGKTDSTYYLVMEYVDGPSLREVMRSPLLDQAAALKIVLEICRAIDYAHNRGVIHRDLKPENILFDEQAGGIAKVTDFGLAGFADGAYSTRFNLTETHVAMGTASYMAPEQRVDAKTADHRADVWSLGVMLYELLVGEVPVGNFDPPSHRKAGLDRRLDAIVAKCLKPVPADRYQKVADLIADLEPMVPATFTQRPKKVSAVGRARAAVQAALRKTVRVVSAAVVLAAIAVLAANALTGRPPPRASTGVELTTEFGSKWPLTGTGRVDPPQSQRRLSLGEGPDTVSIVAQGRKPKVGSAIAFGPPDVDAAAGRATFDVSFEGDDLSLVADVEAAPAPPGLFGTLRQLFSRQRPTPRAALLLLGEPGRYVALVLTPGDEPMLEWALGSEKRGTMVGAIRPKSGPVRLELSIDGKKGQLFAHVGARQDQRLLGDPLEVGREWARLFGEPPKAAVGCIDGLCTFSKVQFEVASEPPPAPSPPAAPVVQAKSPPKATVVKKPQPPKTTTSKRKKGR